MKVVVRGPIKVLGQVLVSIGVEMIRVEVGSSDVDDGTTEEEAIAKEDCAMNCRKRQPKEMEEWNKSAICSVEVKPFCCRVKSASWC